MWLRFAEGRKGTKLILKLEGCHWGIKMGGCVWEREAVLVKGRVQNRKSIRTGGKNMEGKLCQCGVSYWWQLLLDLDSSTESNCMSSTGHKAEPIKILLIRILYIRKTPPNWEHVKPGEMIVNPFQMYLISHYQGLKLPGDRLWQLFQVVCMGFYPSIIYKFLQFQVLTHEKIVFSSFYCIFGTFQAQSEAWKDQRDV